MFTFIDLFAGIGGIRLGMEKQGFKCIFSCEINNHCQKTYFQNFNETPFPDITKLNSKDIPDHDILCAGFPCQPFSISGKQKGFEDTRGTLFFNICRIINDKKPKVIFLENVKHIINHDKGNTLNIIISSLEDLGYCVNWKIFNASDYGVPQNRERIIIIASKNFRIDFAKTLKFKKVKLSSFLDIDGNFEFLDENEYTLLENTKLQKSGLIFSGYRNKSIRKVGVREGSEHLSRVHKQPNRIYSSEGVHPTLPSQETTGRFYILHKGLVRKLTLNECYKIMGFPNSYKKISPIAEQYKQIGNSVCVPVISEVARLIKEQFFIERECTQMDSQKDIVYNIYNKCVKLVADNNLEINKISEEEKKLLKIIIDKSESSKGVLTVFITSLVQKIFNPKQDIRFHQQSLPNGYSGRAIDAQYITPFLKNVRFPSMSESGWLTRSLEQNSPYDLNYRGRITPVVLKDAFLKLLNFVQEENSNAENYLMFLFINLLLKRDSQVVELAKPTNLTISLIVEYLDKHFNYKYASRGASRLPTLAIYSAYECMIKEMKRFKHKQLLLLEEHTSSDSKSGRVGDIDILDENGRVFEGIEIKHGISITAQLIRDCYEKFKVHPVKRYYLLSTANISENELKLIEDEIFSIKNLHGCQVIVNGVQSTLKYYLRLLDNTYDFIENYVKNVEIDKTLKFEHKQIWNNIVSQNYYH